MRINMSEQKHLEFQQVRFGMPYNGYRSAIKKTLFHPKADEGRRNEFRAKIAQYEEKNRAIVYLDESGFAVDSPRTYGYSQKGQRCYGERDWHARGRVNAIGAIIEDDLITVSVFEVNIDSDIFYAWLTQDLIPKLPKGSIVVMDNATFHKRTDMIEALITAGHIPEYLPPYSPDLNPIEHKWAQVKAIRKQKRCSVSEVFSYV